MTAPNHWGWTPRGVANWLRYGWAWPLAVWGVEESGSSPPRFRRRVKVGPICFGWGFLPKEKTSR